MTIEAKDIHDAVKALSDAMGPKSDLAEVVKILIWPIVVVLGLWGFRRPLSRLLEALGQRITKFSVFHIEVELASVAIPSLSLAELIPFPGEDVTGGGFSPTTIMELLRRIRDDAPPRYLLVDIGDGKRWLISRLFLFSFVLWRIGAIRSVVFVETKEDLARRFLGIASPERICDALGSQYAWFRTALGETWTESCKSIPPYSGWLPRHAAEALVQDFKRKIQKTNEPSPSDGWEPLGQPGQETWEHTKWLGPKQFNENLRAVCFDSEESQLVDSPDAPADRRNQGLLRRRVPFVALVNTRGEMKYLVEREAFLERVAAYLGKEMERTHVPMQTITSQGDRQS